MNSIEQDTDIVDDIQILEKEKTRDKDDLFNPVESRQTEREIHEPEFSIFGPHERMVLILILSLVGFWSTASSPIYFPALPTLTAYFHTTPSVMNLSVVAYLVFQGIAPTVSSNLADNFGRRPVILACILIFIAACIAISRTNVYWLLAVLRCVQAAGIGPVIAISSGVAGDVCTSADRGGFVGIVAGIQLLGNGMGGMVGAALINQFNSWRAIFIFLAIGAGATLIFSFFFLPETSRRIVGNGSIVPKHFISKSALIYLPHFKKRINNDTTTLEPPTSFDFLSPFKIFFKKTVFLTLLPGGLHFAAWTVTLTCISTYLEQEPYNYTVLQVGFVYLPQGLSCLVASILIGRTLNWYYRYSLKKYNDKYQDALLKPRFNIFRARMTVCIVPAVLMIIGLVIFGWCLHYHQHIASIIVSSILIAMSSSSFIAAMTTMLVDMHPNNGSASTSCLNLMRCLQAALFSGVLENMIASMGLGGTFTLLAGLCIVLDLCLVYVVISVSKNLRETSALTTPVESDNEVDEVPE
ncbi:hypothetical protein G9P44_005953 [Scheffersomyces stipitis]|nr:hypothetical protein G9P44_005953 [Scheffersomyces stipitis]